METAAPSPRRYSAGERIALFIPCYVDLIYPDVGRAVVALFDRLGVPLEYPEDQTCCGQPAFNAGYWDQARRVAAHFAATFDGYPWIVVPSGSCGAMCRTFYSYMDPGSPAARVGHNVYDLSTFLVRVLGFENVGARFPHRVTYHDGCHARRELRSGEDALRLLSHVKGLELVELPAIEECCGFGGLFSVKFAEVSASMGAAKCGHIEATGAEYVASGDMSCLMHVGGMLAKRGAAAQPIHLAQVLAAT